MSFNNALRGMEQLLHYKDSACSAGKLFNSKKEEIEQKYPLQYAFYQKNKEMKKMRDRLIGQVISFALKIIYPNGMNFICHFTPEECYKKGEQFIEDKHLYYRDHLQILLDTIQEFRKYPMDFEECIQDDDYWKECIESTCNVKVESYFKGMLFRIRKDYKQHIPEPVQEHVLESLPEPKKVKKVTKKEKDPVPEPVQEHVPEPKKVKKVTKKEKDPVPEPVSDPEQDPVPEPKKVKKVKKTESVTEPVSDPVPEPKKENKVKKVTKKEKVPVQDPVQEPDLEPLQEPKKEPEPFTEKVSEKVKKKSIPSTVKRLVWNKNIGEEIGKSKCYCCKTTYITQSSFHCGHVISEAKGGETIVNNLKPICQNCNSSMGSKDMNEFMNSLG